MSLRGPNSPFADHRQTPSMPHSQNGTGFARISNRHTYEKLELLVSTFRMRGKRFPNRHKITPFCQNAVVRFAPLSGAMRAPLKKGRVFRRSGFETSDACPEYAAPKDRSQGNRTQNDVHRINRQAVPRQRKRQVIGPRKNKRKNRQRERIRAAPHRQQYDSGERAKRNKQIEEQNIIEPSGVALPQIPPRMQRSAGPD